MRVQFLSLLLENIPEICYYDESWLSFGPILGAAIHVRLKDDIDPEWHAFDSSLKRIAKDSMVVLQPHHAISLVDIIEDREWKESELLLQVRAGQAIL